MEPISRHYDIAKGIMGLEKDLNLCEWVVAGVTVWDYIRFPLSRFLEAKVGAVGQAHSTLPLLRHVGKQLKGLPLSLWKNPFTVGQRDILFYGNPRRKLEADGMWWDIYSDPIIEVLPWSYLYLEPHYLGAHYRPTKTKNIRYLDSLHLANKARRMLYRGRTIHVRDEKMSARVEKAILEIFGVGIDLGRWVERILVRHHVALPMYRYILRRVKPKVVILVCSYGKETFIAACKVEKIPVIELQHGVIYEGHLGYSFPCGCGKQYFPDYLLSFGDFWVDRVQMPIDRSRVHSVGFPYLELQHQKHPPAQKNTSTERDLGILFLSQGTIGKELSKFAVSAREKLGPKHKITFKLHPGEYGRWRSEYPWLSRSDITVMEDDSHSLYQLFSENDVQVGVYSTALYEGLTYNLDTVLVDLPGIGAAAHLVDRGFATLVESVDQLVNYLPGVASPRKRDTSGFFQEDSLWKILRAIEAIMAERGYL